MRTVEYDNAKILREIFYFHLLMDRKLNASFSC